MDRFAAGLRVVPGEGNLLPPEAERTSIVGATAVLVEPLAIEAAVCADSWRERASLFDDEHNRAVFHDLHNDGYRRLSRCGSEASIDPRWTHGRMRRVAVGAGGPDG